MFKRLDIHGIGAPRGLVIDSRAPRLVTLVNVGASVVRSTDVLGCGRKSALL